MIWMEIIKHIEIMAISRIGCWLFLNLLKAIMRPNTDIGCNKLYVEKGAEIQALIIYHTVINNPMHIRWLILIYSSLRSNKQKLTIANDKEIVYLDVVIVESQK